MYKKVVLLPYAIFVEFVIAIQKLDHYNLVLLVRLGHLF